MADAWTHVRVRTTTADRLRDRIREMREEYWLGHQSRTPVVAGELSVDALVNWLLDEREEHRARARRAKGARRAKDASAGEPASEPDSDAEAV